MHFYLCLGGVDFDTPYECYQICLIRYFAKFCLLVE